MFKNIFRSSLIIINRLLPKLEHVMVHGSPNIESSAIEVANYITKNYEMPVYFVVSKDKKGDPKELLLPGIRIIESSGLNFMMKYFTAKYIYFTHGSPLQSFSKNQMVVNIWHGLLYKKIGKLMGGAAIPAKYTAAASPLTKKMFSEAFGISENSICQSGFPRNDVMIRSKRDKSIVKDSVDRSWNGFDKIVIWLPTYRSSIVGSIRDDGKEVGNPFYIEDFDVNQLNELLTKRKTLCIVKPHPMAPPYPDSTNTSNLLFIDDNWLSDHNITLYHLAGISDMLISDVSSIMIDYLLINQPIVCISGDFEEYKQSRGFYFENIEEWIPSEILTSQHDFFLYLDSILVNGHDAFETRRSQLKQKFFSDHDDQSTERLVKMTMGSDRRPASV